MSEIILPAAATDGVKFEKDCTRTSSLVISTLDNTARFTTTVHIKDGAQSIALR